jgi:small GTP-binding protein
MGVFSSKPARVLIIGLSGSGKTSLLYQMVGVPNLTPIPTIGFNVETFARDNVQFTAWDVGGRGKIKEMWRYYNQDVEGVLFVCDATDPTSLDEAADAFLQLVSGDEFVGCPFVLLANKYDLPEAISIREIANKFKVAEVKQPITIQQASVKNNEGVEQAFKWLAEQVAKKRQ